MRVKIEWLTAYGPAANLLCDGENIGRLYHDGIGWAIVVHGKRAGGYAQVRQIMRDAAKMHRDWLKANVAVDRS